MKIKLFKREAISDGYYSNGMARYRRENNKELEVRVNEFMADKKVVDIKYQEATHGNYEDMDSDNWFEIKKNADKPTFFLSILWEILDILSV